MRGIVGSLRLRGDAREVCEVDDADDERVSIMYVENLTPDALGAATKAPRTTHSR